MGLQSRFEYVSFSLRRLTPKVRMLSFEEMPYIQFEDDSEHDIQNRLEWLYSSISRLKPIDKALVLMWLDELSYDEIAENMGIPRNTVASRLHRIKEKLSTK